ncbi:MAG TPA: DUF2867 domain-containing protein [Solirubrobacteraceae bacterium]|jgi:hypothetical protein|nr:DUF2867 domain-containing protein [Solirubrobacteraceae bacterium]
MKPSIKGVKGQARLPNSAHISHPWRIHELTADFQLEDVWALPVHGEQGDFPALVQGLTAGDPSQGSWLARALWTIRWKLGELLGWDEAETGLGERVPTLRQRLPKDLLDAPGPGFDALPFTPLYLTGDEFAAEIANHTMHGVMHLGWVADGTGGWRGQMAVLVKPNGLLGAIYIASIRPFRHLIIYPAMMRQIERDWTRAARTGLTQTVDSHES